MPVELTISKESVKKVGSWLIPLLVIVGLIVLLVCFVSNRAGAIGDEIQENRVQAVSLTNGGLFYGHLEVLDGKTLLLKDAHNLRQQGGNDAKVVVASITTLADRPTKDMIIPVARVAYIENLSKSSPVAKRVDG